MKTRSDRMVVAFSVGERIREGKILFVVAADSLPEKVLCRGHYFSSALRASEAKHDQAEMKYRSDCNPPLNVVQRI